MTVDIVSNFPFFSIFLMMFTGILTAPVKNGRTAWKMSFVSLSAVFIMSAVLLSRVARSGESFAFMMGHFPAPWGNEIRAGIVEAVMAVLFSLVTLLSVSAGKYDIFSDILPQKQNLYFIMLNLLTGAMLSLIYTNDIFTAYVFIEISTIAACSLIMAKDSSRSMVATLRYLIMMLLGSGLFLLGIIMLYCVTGHLLMPNLQTSVALLYQTGKYNLPLRVIVGLIVTGIAIKSALFPFHTMLPGAHSVCTTTSSALLSGLVLKSFIILLIKLIFRVFTVEMLTELGVTRVLLALSLLAMIICSLLALRESDLKRMIAYSSAAQIGYIYLGIALASTGGAVIALFHIIAHALCKSMLFLCAGSLSGVSGHQTDLHALRGAGYRNRFAAVGFTVGALAMIGLPLFPGFITKLYLAVDAAGSPVQFGVVLGALIISMLCNALYFTPAMIAIWTRRGDVEKAYVAPSFKISIALLVAANLVLGSCFAPVLQLLEKGVASLM